MSKPNINYMSSNFVMNNTGNFGTKGSQTDTQHLRKLYTDSGGHKSSVSCLKIAVGTINNLNFRENFHRLTTLGYQKRNNNSQMVSVIYIQNLVSKSFHQCVLRTCVRELTHHILVILFLLHFECILGSEILFSHLCINRSFN